jgi:hypothetical protein
LGRTAEAQAIASDLLRIDPGFKVRTFLERSPTAPYALGQTVAMALEGAGIPS